MIRLVALLLSLALLCACADHSTGRPDAAGVGAGMGGGTGFGGAPGTGPILAPIGSKLDNSSSK
jgi:hypothetical protein